MNRFVDPHPVFDLGGRTALITGSSQGLGLAFARGLARAGAAIVLNGRDPGKLGLAADQLRAEGARVETTVFDVTDSAASSRAVARLESSFSPIDILINNAGIHRRALLLDMTDEQWRSVTDTNLTGAFFVTRAVAPNMIARKAGKIINICSLASDLARPSTGNYAAAKGGLKMLTRAMAVEWGRSGVQVNGIAPGYFATELNQSLVKNTDFNAWVCQRTPAGRWGESHELVGTAIFLSSRASDFVNGQIITVDGGMSASL